MWLCDLQIAVQELHQVCPDYVFTEVVPAGSGIAFYTTHHSRVFWSQDGNIFERDENGNIEWLTPIPNIC